MKNNSKILILLFFWYFILFQSKILAEEIFFDTLELNITNNGNMVNAGTGSVISKDDNIKIDAQSFKYNKIELKLNATNGFAIVGEEETRIKADKFIYDKNLSTLKAIGNVEINNLKSGIFIKSEDIFYQKNNELIESSVKSTFIDKLGNNIVTDKFTYTLTDNLIKIYRAKITSVENDIIEIDQAYLNLLTNRLIGKDVSINFSEKNFNKDNEPRLKGKTINHIEENTIVEKGIFTTCKKNDDCPPWQFMAKKIIHNKKKKTINYENVWLKIYDKPVIYFPKFFHPDPTVKRQSGFLMPSFESSNLVGTAFSLPYFYAISDNKDLTIKPRFYSTNKLLTQSEFRVVNANSKHTIDASILSEKELSSNNHFFSNSYRELDFDSFDDSSLSFQVQRVTGNTYLKKYKLKSPLIDDTSTLTSTVKFSSVREDLSLDVEMIAYEDLGEEKSSDKYEFIYPNYSLRKKLNTGLVAIGDFNLDSSGYMKNYNTNIFEKVVINDFLFSSYPTFSNSGLKNNYNILIKNTNTDSKNSIEYKEKLDTKIATLLEYNSSYPLEKKTNDFTNILKPIISARYSPNKSKNAREDDKRIDTDNIFSLNRIGSNESVEGGGSLSFGTEFYKSDKSDREIIAAKIANVLKLEEDENLAHNSSLGRKTSDIVGNITYNPSEIFQINYEFSQDENLKDTNYQSLESEFRVNNFVTSFEYLNENNTNKNLSYLSNKTTYNFNETKSLRFETRENKETKAIEFYNLLYEYKNDCLIAGIQYNKDYYTDRDVKPEESIFFKLTIIPFGQTKSPNLKK